jgi:integrase
MVIELKGLYWTFTSRADGSRTYYYYAWKGGPLIFKSPHKITAASPELVSGYQRAYASRKRGTEGLIAGLIQSYRSSPEWKRLAPRTKADYLIWLDRIEDRFGDMPLEGADDRGVVRHFLAWRDERAASPRQADQGVAVLRMLLGWGKARGRLDFNRAEGIGKLYSVDKSQNVWTDAEIGKAAQAASVDVSRAIRLASWIGLRLGDLIDLRWEQVKDGYIDRPTNKSRGRRLARIPLTQEAEAILAECSRDGSHVLTNSRSKPWTAHGLSHAITDAARKAGVQRTTHDLRRTCATRLARLGFTDQEVADMMGWTLESVQQLRRVYVDRGAVILSAIERLKDRRNV